MPMVCDILLPTSFLLVQRLPFFLQRREEDGMAELNPQPLPPGISLDAFMEAVTRGVLRALEARRLPQGVGASEETAARIMRPPIIIGIILDPTPLE